MLSIATRKKFGRHCYADLCEELPICVAEKYPTLRIRGYMSARSASLRKKNSSAVPLLRSGHMSAICAVPSKEMGDSQEGRNLGVYPLVRPRGVSAVPFASKAKNHRLSKDYIMIKES